MSGVDDAAERLAEAGLLTEQQATVFVWRDVEAVPRQAVARELDLSASTVDNYLATAREKVEQAESTLAIIEDLRTADTPDRCAECGNSLQGSWVEIDDRAICPSCADVDPAEI